MILRKSGMVSRTTDLKIDAAAKSAALAVRAADSGYASERFLSRYLDYLHEHDNAELGAGYGPGELGPENLRRRRRRRNRIDLT